MSSNNKGIVYLLTNRSMPGLVKIGMTSREDLDSRLKELYTTGVPEPFECAYACKVTRFRELEEALHAAFEPQRVNPNREFFRIKPSQAVGILSLFNDGNITADVIQEMENDLTEEDQVVQRKKRCPLNFYDMGLKDGDQLVFMHDGHHICTVAAAKKVIYQGETTSLTSVTTRLLKSKYSVQPTPHWLFNGKNLLDIYEEWQNGLHDEENDEPN